MSLLYANQITSKELLPKENKYVMQYTSSGHSHTFIYKNKRKRFIELAIVSSISMSELLEIIQELTSLRLSSHQVSLLLSSIWVQASWIENTPANFQALAHTYSIALLFSRSKVGYSGNAYVLSVFHFSCAALIVVLIVG